MPAGGSARVSEARPHSRWQCLKSDLQTLPSRRIPATIQTVASIHAGSIPHWACPSSMQGLAGEQRSQVHKAPTTHHCRKQRACSRAACSTSLRPCLPHAADNEQLAGSGRAQLLSSTAQVQRASYTYAVELLYIIHPCMHSCVRACVAQRARRAQRSSERVMI